MTASCTEIQRTMNPVSEIIEGLSIRFSMLVGSSAPARITCGSVSVSAVYYFMHANDRPLVNDAQVRDHLAEDRIARIESFRWPRIAGHHEDRNRFNVWIRCH